MPRLGHDDDLLIEVDQCRFEKTSSGSLKQFDILTNDDNIVKSFHSVDEHGTPRCRVTG
jgi:hypothetical protein